MSSLRDQILSQYLNAATTIASSQHASSSHQNTTTDTSPKASQPKETDVKALAIQQLLHRQARILIKLHESLRKDSTYVDVNEELLRMRLDDLSSVCVTMFYAHRFDLLPYCWRWIYTDTLILVSYHDVLRAARWDSFDEDVVDKVVESLDRALIIAGGAGKSLGKRWIEKTLELLGSFWEEEEAFDEKEASEEEEQRPPKRIKRDAAFSTLEPFGRPSLVAEKTCPRWKGWTMDKFEKYMNEESQGKPLPIVLTDLTRDWPAFSDMPWSSPEYLLSRTFGGRRLVPVEVGRSYVDQGWSQELIQFKHFLSKYIDPSIITTSNITHIQTPKENPQPEKIGYLAQHNLFQQIPTLRKDIQVPDFCWADVPLHPTDSTKDQTPLLAPQLNAWFGPARTITPLHTDGYHNLLCQVVGTKYVRLYSPDETRRLRPRGMEYGVDMSNTSELDVGVLEGWDDDEDNEDGVNDWESIRKELKDVAYWETILNPGDTLVIPIGWWHYVRSLSISFSVSFWWN